MIKNLTKLEHKIGEKTFHFLCDVDSTTIHVKEALYQMLGYVDSVEQAAKAQPAAAVVEPVVEEVKP